MGIFKKKHGLTAIGDALRQYISKPRRSWFQSCHLSRGTIVTALAGQASAQRPQP